MKATGVVRSLLMRVALLFAAVVVALCLGAVSGQQNTFNEREVKSEASPLDDPKLDIWTLDFRFKDPRLIKVNVSGRGTRICWYLWYQVINRTKEPRKFVPVFELVTHDHPAVYYADEALIGVQKAIQKLEDPTGYQEIKNCVEIMKLPIPVSKPPGEAFPRAITGVAIWDGTPADPKARDPKAKDLSDATRYSIFVGGLSNGLVVVDPPRKGESPIVRHKTLQLNFKRTGDRLQFDSRDISFVAPAEWIYRASQLRLPGEAGKANEKKGAPPRPMLQPELPKAK